MRMRFAGRTVVPYFSKYGERKYRTVENRGSSMLPPHCWNTLLQFQKSPSVVDKKPPDVVVTD